MKRSDQCLVTSGEQEKVAPDALSAQEAIRLKFCEEQIVSKQQAFMDVGAALVTIRDARLYRVKFSTFEKYCVAQFGFSDRRARQYIDAFEMVFGLSQQASATGTIVPLPTNEAQARALASVEPEQRLEVLQAAAEKCAGEPTAKAIKEAAEAVNPAPPSAVAVNFSSSLARLTKQIAKLAELSQDQIDLECLEEELNGALERVRERRAVLRQQVAA